MSNINHPGDTGDPSAPPEFNSSAQGSSAFALNPAYSANEQNRAQQAQVPRQSQVPHQAQVALQVQRNRPKRENYERYIQWEHQQQRWALAEKWSQYQQQLAQINKYSAFAGAMQVPLPAPMQFTPPGPMPFPPAGPMPFPPPLAMQMALPGPQSIFNPNMIGMQNPLTPKQPNQNIPRNGQAVAMPSNNEVLSAQPSLKMGNQGSRKIMLPPPRPSHVYLLQASHRPEVTDPPYTKLVILDLNGTLLYRPNSRNAPKSMIERPKLSEFLNFLFNSFAVMVWSSVKPENIKTLVEAGFGDMQSQLVAVWARDKFGLAPHHYSQNVQCYKDLTHVWNSAEVQRSMHNWTGRFDQIIDQRNTILVDDSALKASAQPYNLLEIPEFVGDPDEGKKYDILAEVAGYLELLKMQSDVSKFIHKTPFKANGTWSFKWEHLEPKGN